MADDEQDFWKQTASGLIGAEPLVKIGTTLGQLGSYAQDVMQSDPGQVVSDVGSRVSTGLGVLEDLAKKWGGKLTPVLSAQAAEPEAPKPAEPAKPEQPAAAKPAAEPENDIDALAKKWGLTKVAAPPKAKAAPAPPETAAPEPEPEAPSAPVDVDALARKWGLTQIKEPPKGPKATFTPGAAQDIELTPQAQQPRPSALAQPGDIELTPQGTTPLGQQAPRPTVAPPPGTPRPPAARGPVAQGGSLSPAAPGTALPPDMAVASRTFYPPPRTTLPPPVAQGPNQPTAQPGDIELTPQAQQPPAAKTTRADPNDPSGGPYGRRWDEKTKTYSGPPKGDGWLGPLINADGDFESEFSRDADINGKPTQYPLIVPTLTREEVQSLLDGKPVSDSIEEKAAAFAKQRIDAGKDPFAGPGEQQIKYPDLLKRKPQGVPAGSSITLMMPGGRPRVYRGPLTAEEVEAIGGSPTIQQSATSAPPPQPPAPGAPPAGPQRGYFNPKTGEWTHPGPIGTVPGLDTPAVGAQKFAEGAAAFYGSLTKEPSKTPLTPKQLETVGRTFYAPTMTTEQKNALADMFEGTMEMGTPIAIATGLVAPFRTGLTIGMSWMAAQGTGMGVAALGGDEASQRLAADIVGLATAVGIGTDQFQRYVRAGQAGTDAFMGSLQAEAQARRLAAYKARPLSTVEQDFYKSVWGGRDDATIAEQIAKLQGEPQSPSTRQRVDLLQQEQAERLEKAELDFNEQRKAAARRLSKAIKNNDEFAVTSALRDFSKLGISEENARYLALDPQPETPPPPRPPTPPRQPPPNPVPENWNTEEGRAAITALGDKKLVAEIERARFGFFDARDPAVRQNAEDYLSALSKEHTDRIHRAQMGAIERQGHRIAVSGLESKELAEIATNEQPESIARQLAAQEELGRRGIKPEDIERLAKGETPGAPPAAKPEPPKGPGGTITATKPIEPPGEPPAPTPQPGGVPPIPPVLPGGTTPAAPTATAPTAAKPATKPTEEMTDEELADSFIADKRAAGAPAVAAAPRTTGEFAPTDVEGAHEKRDYASTQVAVRGPAADAVRQFASEIPDEDLAENGREDDPHVTVKYGLHDDDPETIDQLTAMLADVPPITATLGETSLFLNDESGSGDVVKVDVESPELHDLNEQIAKAFDNTDTHPDYQPHLTIAYVKPGKGQKYDGDKAFVGQKLTFDHLTFATKDGRQIDIPLGGTAQPAVSAADVSKLPAERRMELLKQLRGKQDKAKRGGTPLTQRERDLMTALQPAAQPRPAPRTYDKDAAQATYKRFKTRLTKAENRKDPYAVMREAVAFNDHYQDSPEPMPDFWSRWQRAYDDAREKVRREHNVNVPDLEIGHGTPDAVRQFLGPEPKAGGKRGEVPETQDAGAPDAGAPGAAPAGEKPKGGAQQRPTTTEGGGEPSKKRGGRKGAARRRAQSQRLGRPEERPARSAAEREHDDAELSRATTRALDAGADGDRDTIRRELDYRLGVYRDIVPNAPVDEFLKALAPNWWRDLGAPDPDEVPDDEAIDFDGPALEAEGRTAMPRGPWFHGTQALIPDVSALKQPIFLTRDPKGADWFASERMGYSGAGGHDTIYPFYVDVTNPFQIRNEQDGKALYDILTDAGIEATFTPSTPEKPGWELDVPDVEKLAGHSSMNPIDVVYLPKAVEALKRAGYDGFYDPYDPLEMGHIESLVPFDLDQIVSVYADEDNLDGHDAYIGDGAAWHMPDSMDPADVLPAPARLIRAKELVGDELLSQEDADARIAEWKAEAKRIGAEEDHSKDVIFSLFDRTGEWSKPWEDAGYTVIRYDIATGHDLVEFMPTADIMRAKKFGRIVGVMAAPPCTSYSNSGRQWWPDQHDKADQEMLEEKYGFKASRYFDTPLDYANTLVEITRAFIGFANPKRFHVVENPTGRIAEQNDLPSPLLRFDPYQFGDPYTKKTNLWGTFNPNLPTANVEPTKGSFISVLRGDVPAQKARRSVTPEGFAYAFFMANRHPVAAEKAQAAEESKWADLEQEQTARYTHIYEVSQEMRAARAAGDTEKADELQRQHRAAFLEYNKAYEGIEQAEGPEAARDLTMRVERDVHAAVGQKEQQVKWNKIRAMEQTIRDAGKGEKVPGHGKKLAGLKLQLKDLKSDYEKGYDWIDRMTGDDDITDAIRQQVEKEPVAPGAKPKLTYEEFAKQYRDAFERGQKYTPTQAGFGILAEKMADLADEYPDFLERLEAEEEELFKAGVRVGEPKPAPKPEVKTAPEPEPPPVEDEDAKARAALVAEFKAKQAKKADEPRFSQREENLDRDAVIFLVKYVRLAIKGGETEFAQVAHLFQDEFGEGARGLDWALEAAWERLKGETVSTETALQEPRRKPIKGTHERPQPGPGGGVGGGGQAGQGEPGQSPRGPRAPGQTDVAVGEPGAPEGVSGKPAGPELGGSSGATGGVSGARPGTKSGGKRPTSGRSGGTDAPGNVDATDATDSDDVKDADARGEAPRHYIITGEEHLTTGGATSKLNDNLAAIRLLKLLQRENRPASGEEQGIIARYVGWGNTALKPVVDPRGIASIRDPKNKEARQELDMLLTKAEIDSLWDSVLNAHYSFVDIPRAMWDAVQRMGFKGGSILEPAVGSGHFLGTMPGPIVAHPRTRIFGVDLEMMASGIARQLYQDANIQTSPLQEARLPKDYFDLIISNVPFARLGVFDPDFVSPDRKVMAEILHNYYFGKALDLVRPGGLIAFVTSKGTMDSQSNGHRRYIDKRARLLGAIRLPMEAFKKNAGTEVVTDIIFLQRRLEDELPADDEPKWIHSNKREDLGKEWDEEKEREDWVHTNEYYATHPEMILGKEARSGTMYRGGSYNVEGFGGKLDPDKFQEALNRLPENIYVPSKAPPRKLAKEADANTKQGTYILDGKKLYINDQGTLAPAGLKGKQLDIVLKFLPIRDAYQKTLDALLSQADKPTLEAEQAKLRKAYDAFFKKYGSVNEPINRRLIEGDPNGPRVLGLEHIQREKVKGRYRIKVVGHADIFSKRVIAPPQPPTHSESPGDALSQSMAWRGQVDLDWMGGLLDMAPLEVAQALVGEVFQDAGTDAWYPKALYLSGDVVTKLAQAEARADVDPAFKANVEALKAVQPKPMVPDEFVVPFGASYVPMETYQAFLNEVAHQPITVNFVSTEVQAHFYVADAVGSHEFLPQGEPLSKWIEDALNGELPDKYSGTGKDRAFDPVKTEGYHQSLQQLREQWAEWWPAEPEHGKRLTDIHNAMFNREVAPKYDDVPLILPNANPDVKFRTWQNRGVTRTLLTGNTLLNHAPGSGKTLEGVAIASEWKRRGLATKIIITVPNPVTEGWRKSFLDLYPTARVLVTTKEDFEKKNRKRLMARVASNDWDAIVMGHKQYESIPVKIEYLREFIKEQEDQLLVAGSAQMSLSVDAFKALVDAAVIEDQAAQAVFEATGKRPPKGPANRALSGRNVQRSTADIVRMIKRLRLRLQRRLARDEKGDSPLTFEEMGVDGLIVDEAHYFKNLFFYTEKNNIRGLTGSDADRAIDMYLKVRQINKASNYRNVVFLTGTPITNTMSEVYTVFRYLAQGTLDRLGMASADAFLNNYAISTKEIEPAPGGGYREVVRLRYWRNLKELSMLAAKFADTVTKEDMVRGGELKLPKLKNGKVTIIATKPSPNSADFMDDLKARLADIKAGNPRVLRIDDDGEPVMDNHLVVGTDAKKWAIDPRLVDPNQPYDPNGRIPTLSRKVAEVYRETADRKGTQILFLDMGVPKTLDPLPQHVLDAIGKVDLPEVDPEDPEDAEELSEEEQAERAAMAAANAVDRDLYNEIKRELVQNGVQEDEIAFIHQAKGPLEQELLYLAMNEGRIRVLIASREKGGVGVNVQQKVAHILHVDVPWRPDQVEQADARGFRQGNEHADLDIPVEKTIMVTELSFDEFQWGLLSGKNSSIQDFWRGRISSMEDVDIMQQSLEFSSAAATGDPRSMKVRELERVVRGIALRATNFENRQRTARREIGVEEATLTSYQAYLAAVEKGIAEADAWAAKPEVSFLLEAGARYNRSISIRSKPVTFDLAEKEGRADFQAAIETLIRDGSSSKTETMATAGPYTIEMVPVTLHIPTGRKTQVWEYTLDRYVEKDEIEDVRAARLVVNISKLILGSSPDWTGREEDKVPDFAASLRSYMNAKRLHDYKENYDRAIKGAQATLETLNEIVTKVFPQAAELREKRAELEELKIVLGQARAEPPVYNKLYTAEQLAEALIRTDKYLAAKLIDAPTRFERAAKIMERAESMGLTAATLEAQEKMGGPPPSDEPKFSRREKSLYLKTQPPEVTRVQVPPEARDIINKVMARRYGFMAPDGTDTVGDPSEIHFHIATRIVDDPKKIDPITVLLNRGYVRYWAMKGEVALHFKEGDEQTAKAALRVLDEHYHRGDSIYLDVIGGELYNLPHFFDNVGIARNAIRIAGGENLEPRFSRREAPLYSALTRAAEGLKQGKGTPEQMGAMLTKVKGVKAEEVAWSGVLAWLKGFEGKPVTKQQIVDYVKANELKLIETTLGSETQEDKNTRLSLERTITDAGYRIVGGFDEDDPDEEPLLADPRHAYADGDDDGEYYVGKFGGPYADSVPQIVRDAFEAWRDNEIDRHPKAVQYPTYQVAGKRDDYQEILFQIPVPPMGEPEFKVELVTLPDVVPTYAVNFSDRDRAGHNLEALISFNPNARGFRSVGAWHATFQNVEENFFVTPDYSKEAMLAEAIKWAQEKMTAVWPRIEDSVLRADTFRPGHFTEYHNLLVWVRFNTRIDSEGKKVLFIEEIQSDWHQRARRERKEAIKELLRQGRVSSPEEAKAEAGSGYSPTRAERKRLNAELEAADKVYDEAYARLQKAEKLVKYGTGNAEFFEKSELLHDARDAMRVQRKLAGGGDPAKVEQISQGIRRLQDRLHELQEDFIKEYDLAHAANTKAFEAKRRIRVQLEQIVPDAPFKTTWHELALKRTIHYAAEHGYDKIAWTTGAMQVQRYEDELRKVVDTIRWGPGEGKLKGMRPISTFDGDVVKPLDNGYWGVFDPVLEAFHHVAVGEPVREFESFAAAQEWLEDKRAEEKAKWERRKHATGPLEVVALKGGHLVFNATVAPDGTLSNASPSKANTRQLEDVIGKTMAARVLGEPFGEVTGKDLTIGGEGMKGFYDKMMPDFLNRFGKPFGAKVTETQFGKEGETWQKPGGLTIATWTPISYDRAVDLVQREEAGALNRIGMMWGDADEEEAVVEDVGYILSNYFDVTNDDVDEVRDIADVESHFWNRGFKPPQYLNEDPDQTYYEMVAEDTPVHDAPVNVFTTQSMDITPAMQMTARQGFPLFMRQRDLDEPPSKHVLPALLEQDLARRKLLKQTYTSIPNTPIGGKPVAVLDAGQRLMQAELDGILMKPGVQRVAKEMLAVLDEAIAGMLGPQLGPHVERRGILFHRGAFGVYVPKPGMTPDEKRATILLNFLEAMADKQGRATTPRQAAAILFETIVHETAHWEEIEEGSDHLAAMVKLLERVGAQFQLDATDRIRKAYEDPENPGQFDPDLVDALSVYSESRGRREVTRDSVSSAGSYARRPTNDEPGEGELPRRARPRREGPVERLKGETGLLELDALEPAAAQIAKVVKNERNLILSTVSPARVGVAPIAAGNIRAQTAAHDQRNARVDRLFRATKRKMDRWSEAQSLQFMDVMEGVQELDVLPAKWRDVAEVFRALLNNWRDTLVDNDLLESYLEHYWPHEWKKESIEGKTLRKWFGRRPIQGPESYRHKRKFPTTREGIEAGFTPMSLNPTEQLQRKIAEMSQSLKGRALHKDNVKSGLYAYVPATKRVPEAIRNYKRVPEYALGTVYGPRVEEQKFGRVVAGHYYAPPEVVALIEKHLSPGLVGRSYIFDFYKWLGNESTNILLGWSSFHMWMTGLESSLSKASLALELAARGEMKEAAKVAAWVGPQGVFRDLVRGYKAVQEFYSRDADANEVTGVIGQIIQGGGGVGWSLFDQTAAPQKFLRDINGLWGAFQRRDVKVAGEKFGKAIWHGGWSIFELPTKIVMDHWVPYLKIAAFLDMAEMEQRRLGPNPTLEEIRKVYGDAWDAVDDRFGQLRYDNLFWSNTSKQLLTGGILSVGWNVGSLRHGIGVLGQAGRLIQNVGAVAGGGGPPVPPNIPRRPWKPGDDESPRGMQPWVQRNFAWALMGGILIGIAGAIWQYLHTGKRPESLNDLYNPRNGRIGPDGREERDQMISYAKDYYAWSHHPVSTLGHKLKPFLSMLWEWSQNENYYGTQIYDPADPAMQILGELYHDVLHRYNPIAFQNANARIRTGATWGELAWEYIQQQASPFRPAPAEMERSDAETLLHKFQQEQYGSAVKTLKQAEAVQLRRAIREGSQRDATVDERAAAAAARETQLLTRRQVRDALRAGLRGTTSFQAGFKSQSFERALELYDVATPEERAKVRVELLRKSHTALQQAPLATRQALRQRFQSALALPH